MQLRSIQNKIYEVRNYKVMLDHDLARLYDVETKVLKQAVKRNIQRFPGDFLLVLTRDEYNSLRSRIVTLEKGKGQHSKYLPFAFTEQGVAMLSSVLKSKKALNVNVAIMRAFVVMRQYALSHGDLTVKLREIETRYDKKFKDVYDAINYLLQKDKRITEQNNRKQIGYKKN
jgi:hypothetical protein